MDQRLKYLNALRTFESAARHKSYSRSAEELCVSQAAVSQQMRQLEQVLAVKLFIRSGRKMLLTQSGETLYESTHKALNLLINGLNGIQSEEVAGDLTITSTQAFCSLWLMPRLYKFSQQHPNINVSILGSNQKEDLRKKHIDLAIRFGVEDRVADSENLVMEEFGEDFVYPICSEELTKKMNFQVPADLLKTWLVSLENPGPYDWPSWFEHSGIKAYQQHQQWTHVHSTDMALNAVLSGHGFTLAAQYLCTQQLESGQLLMPIKIPHPLTVKRYLVFDEGFL